MFSSLLALFSLTLAIECAHSSPSISQQHFDVPTPAPRPLNLTTIAASNGESVLECWQLQQTLDIFSHHDPGIAGVEIMQLGGLANASYKILPGNFISPPHPAPYVQYVFLLSGLAHITFPSSDASLYVVGGTATSLILAVDIDTTGHISLFPSEHPTVSLEIPTEGNHIPNHTVLHSGPCLSSEQQI